MWRAFRNRRQIGGMLGFAPTKYDSGESTRDQGISRAGNTAAADDEGATGVGLGAVATRQRADAVVSNDFGKGKRARRVGIVAVARKLLIALWRYVTAGVLPAGAVLKDGVARQRSVSRVLRVRFVPGRAIATVTEKVPQHPCPE